MQQISSLVSTVDITPGVQISVHSLRYAHDVTVPEVQRLIECTREAVLSYASMRGADPKVAEHAQSEWQLAYEWCRQVVASFHANGLHLVADLPSREPDFQPFSPSSDMSIYEFFMRFEDYSSDFIPSDSKARVLYSNFLDNSLKNLLEIQEVRNDYEGLKSFLIETFGNIHSTVDSYLDWVIHFQGEDNFESLSHAACLRQIHHCLLALRSLQVSPGIQPPKLQDYLSSNLFLCKLFKSLPTDIRELWATRVAERGERFSRIEGEIQLDLVLSLLRTQYLVCESMAHGDYHQGPALPTYASSSRLFFIPCQSTPMCTMLGKGSLPEATSSLPTVASQLSSCPDAVRVASRSIDQSSLVLSTPCSSMVQSLATPEDEAALPKLPSSSRTSVKDMSSSLNISPFSSGLLNKPRKDTATPAFSCSNSMGENNLHQMFSPTMLEAQNSGDVVAFCLPRSCRESLHRKMRHLIEVEPSRGIDQLYLPKGYSKGMSRRSPHASPVKPQITASSQPPACGLYLAPGSASHPSDEPLHRKARCGFQWPSGFSLSWGSLEGDPLRVPAAA